MNTPAPKLVIVQLEHGDMGMWKRPSPGSHKSKPTSAVAIEVQVGLGQTFMQACPSVEFWLDFVGFGLVFFFFYYFFGLVFRSGFEFEVWNLDEIRSIFALLLDMVVWEWQVLNYKFTFIAPLTFVSCSCAYLQELFTKCRDFSIAMFDAWEI